MQSHKPDDLFPGIPTGAENGNSRLVSAISISNAWLRFLRRATLAYLNPVLNERPCLRATRSCSDEASRGQPIDIRRCLLTVGADMALQTTGRIAAVDLTDEQGLQALDDRICGETLCIDANVVARPETE